MNKTMVGILGGVLLLSACGCDQLRKLIEPPKPGATNAVPAAAAPKPPPPPPSVAPPAPPPPAAPPQVSATQKTIEGLTGRTTVNAGLRTKEKVRAIDAKEDAKTEDVNELMK